MNRILFVDDEENVLHGLKRMLRPLRHEWDMSFAMGGQEAADRIQQEEFNVIVTDMRMPGFDGAKLLEFVIQHDPGIARIVLSGQTDQEDVIRSTGTAHQFISKPCDAEQLKNVLNRTLQIRALLKNKKITSITGAINALPSLPEIYLLLNEEMKKGRENISIIRVGEIITQDVSMSAKVMQLANSAFFGLPGNVETAQHAVKMLGLEVIRALAVSEAVFNSFNFKDNCISLSTLRNHSLTVGNVANALCKQEDVENHYAAMALQAGMLHDIGKLIMSTRMPDEYKAVFEKAKSSNQPLHHIEKVELGCDHGQIGAYLLGLWGLPDGIVEAIAYHHCPEQCPHLEGAFTPLTALHVSNACVLFVQGDENALDTLLNKDWLDSIGLLKNLKKWIETTTSILQCTEQAQ